jgi:hypothetical protein
MNRYRGLADLFRVTVILEDELREHGIRELSRPDFEIMVYSMIERTADVQRPFGNLHSLTRQFGEKIIVQH